MKELYLVFVPQEYETANHRFLWTKMAENTKGDVIIVNIPADLIVSLIKKRKDRKKEAREGFRKITDNCFLLRPFIAIRPEILPKILYRWIAKQIWKCLKQRYPDIDTYNINMLVYNAYWTEVFKNYRPNIKFGYYLIDEVRYQANDNSINKKRYFSDEFACKNSKVIFTMTSELAESRKQYNNNILVIGNGALYASIKPIVKDRIEKTVAFVGNFRNWIDKSILEETIKMRQDIRFCFVGNIESDMKDFFVHLLNDYCNTVYFGKAKKEDVVRYYQMFDCIWIPYKQNDFIYSSRPIKIVEAVFAGTPAITVPVSGYKENSFIRFARSVDEISNQIDFLLDNPIDPEGQEYIRFISENTWDELAKKIIRAFSQ